MFNRYFAPNKHHLITLISLLMFIIGSQNGSAQQRIALDTYAILVRAFEPY